MTVRKSTNLEQDRADLIKFANLDIAENIDVTDCNLRALINLELAQRIAKLQNNLPDRLPTQGRQPN